MLRIESLTYRIGGRTLLEDASATVSAGERVGLVGPNGAGKTTLIRLIAGEIEPDGGVIEVPSRWRVGLTQQEAPGGAANLVETVLAADEELTALTEEAETAFDPDRIGAIHARLHDKNAYSAQARAARILAGLGFDADAQARSLEEFSGGWRMRVALAALLFTEPDLLLLDEPTNHLDLESSLWLEDYLRRYRGTIVIVSHDRDLLNRAVGAILHVDHGKLAFYRGGYNQFEETRRVQMELDEKHRRKQDLVRVRMQTFVDRFRYKASKARQAQSRLKMLERMVPTPELANDSPGMKFEFPAPPKLAPPLFSLDNASVGYDGKAVLSRLSLRIDPDDRIALLGANGNGKSTFAKLLAGRLTLLGGQATRSDKLQIGYFAQHQLEELDSEATPIVELSRRRPRDPAEKIRAHLARFGLIQQRAETKVSKLSGGEKARLVFALITCEQPQLLVLDEPTNHLDLVAREALIRAINEFEGAVVLVTHDPHLIGLTADRLWLVQGGLVAPYDGDMDQYRASMLERGNNGSAREQVGGQQARQSDDRREQRRAAAGKRQSIAPLKKQLAATERRIEALNVDKLRIIASLADPKIYEGIANVAELQLQLGQTVKTLAVAEEAWLALQAEIESAGVDAN